MIDNFVEKVLCGVCGALLDINGVPLPIEPEPESYPVLIPPFHTFTLNNDGLFFEVGDVVGLVFNIEFDRGSLYPAYGTNGYRSGTPLYYKFSGDGISGEFLSKDILSDTRNLTYKVLSGLQTWEAYVHYLRGDQPVGSLGNAFDDPLPEGNTSPSYVELWGVYPYIANTTDLSILTKQPLVMMNSPYVDIDFLAESNTHKQIVEFPNDWWVITGIEIFYDDDWIWLNGSKENSLSTFTVTNSTNVIQNITVGYKRFTHNGSKIGSRKLRFHTR